MMATYRVRLTDIHCVTGPEASTNAIVCIDHGLRARMNLRAEHDLEFTLGQTSRRNPGAAVMLNEHMSPAEPEIDPLIAHHTGPALHVLSGKQLPPESAAPRGCPEDAHRRFLKDLGQPYNIEKRDRGRLVHSQSPIIS